MDAGSRVHQSTAPRRSVAAKPREARVHSQMEVLAEQAAAAARLSNSSATTARLWSYVRSLRTTR